MQVSLNWLKEYLDLSQSSETIANALTIYGLEVEGIKELEGNILFEIALTPNLGHCMSIIGIARELSAILQIPLRRKKIILTEDAPAFPLSIHIEEKNLCSQYLCRIVHDVTIGPSPKWIIQKLESSGLRSVNVVVDIGNLVMLECGQPLHMFDLDALFSKQKEIIIRKAKKDGKILTLDEIERDIPNEALLVCAGEKPIAFAGVMGEFTSSVFKKTKNVLIEAAVFSPTAVRNTSKLLNLKTESSQRFERGIDPLGVRSALDMAAALLQEITGAHIAKKVIETITQPYQPHLLEVHPERVNRLLGVNLSVHEMCLFLGRLEIEVLSDTEKEIKVAIPSYRNDIKAEVDLIEEIGRLYGLNHIPRTTPLHASSPITHAPIFMLEEETRDKLVGLGLQECLTCDLISPELAELTMEKALDKDMQIHVLYPASIDQSVLRSSLLPSLLEVVQFNLDRQNENLAVFEVGNIHFKMAEKFLSEPVAGILLTGKEHPYHFEEKPKDFDFFHLKGFIENALHSLGITTIDFEPSHLQNFHPGRQARIKTEETTLGALGEVHPQHLKKLEIKQRVYYAEINLLECMQLRKKKGALVPIPLFPGSVRDWTMTIAEKISVGSIIEELKHTPSPILENVFLLDFYKSDKIGKDKKNVTLRFQYRDPNKTIAYEEVEKEHKRLIEHIAEKFAIV